MRFTPSKLKALFTLESNSSHKSTSNYSLVLKITNPSQSRPCEADAVFPLGSRGSTRKSWLDSQGPRHTNLTPPNLQIASPLQLR